MVLAGRPDVRHHRHSRNGLLYSKQPFPEASNHEEALKRGVHIAGVPKVVEPRRHAGALRSEQQTCHVT